MYMHVCVQYRGCDDVSMSPATRKAAGQVCSVAIPTPAWAAKFKLFELGKYNVS